MDKKKMLKLIAQENENLVQIANAQENPFESLSAFHKFSRNGFEVNLKCCRVQQLNKETQEWTFNLLERNIKNMYEASSWGWDAKGKCEEMTEEAAWYLIAYNMEGRPLAFSHFRFDIDYGSPILYCYEIHLENECRRKGLGRFMLQILELLAFKANLDKVVLTVFLHNPEARTFFKKLGYSVDETNPVSLPDVTIDYEILSKINKKKLASSMTRN